MVCRWVRVDIDYLVVQVDFVDDELIGHGCDVLVGNSLSDPYRRRACVEVTIVIGEEMVRR